MNDHDNDQWHFTLHPSLDLIETSAAFRFLHPTHATLTNNHSWSSRSHRKGRYVRHTLDTTHKRHHPSLWLNLWQLRRIEYWNISWWVAMSFVVGSIIWVINGFAIFLPTNNPDAYEKMPHLAGWTAFIGATIFEIGSTLGVLEAWNRDSTLEFGYEVERLVEPKLFDTKPKRTWIWFSTDPRYWRELGFLSAIIQWFAATIFWISGFTAIPTIQSAIEENKPLYDGVYWSPQVVGGSGFIISPILLLLENQKRWYLPAPLVLGWHIAFWNLVGGIGFTLSGAMGYAMDDKWAEYQSALTTFWGGWAFLIASLLQWYESVNAVDEQEKK